MSQSKGTILIIEDDPVVAGVYRSKFEKNNFEVEIAADGQAGFYRVLELHPNVVLLDLMLPHMNGLEILKKIRAQKRFQKTPIFVFTNAFLSEIAMDAEDAGADAVFNKATTTPQDIVNTIEQTLFPPRRSPEPAPLETRPTPDPALATAPSSAPVTSPAPATETDQPAQAQEKKAESPVLYEDGGDTEFNQLQQRSFWSNSSQYLSDLRRIHQALVREQEENKRAELLLELAQKVHSLTSNSAVVNLQNIAHYCSALEALLKELNTKPEKITASTLRTLAHSLDFLGAILSRQESLDNIDPTSANILVVDDELLSRRAITHALQKARLKSVAVEDPKMALKLLSETSFDIIFLDADMPGMDGYELCTKIRERPDHKSTPVIFVTGLTGFESRTRSTLSGANDFIAKPFLFVELAVKALILAIDGKRKAASK